MGRFDNHRPKVAGAVGGRSGPRPGLPRQFLYVALLVVAGSQALGLAAASAQTPAPPPAEKLRVVTKPVEPFVIAGEDGSLSGFSIDLWQAIVAQLGQDYEWIYLETVAEQLQAVKDGRADVAVAAISMTPEREQLVDFSHPYFDAGLRVLTRPQDGDPSVRSLIASFFSPALFRILGISLLVLLAMAHVIWLMERGHNPEMPRSYLSGIWEAFWWSLSTIATHKYGEGEEPRTFFRRLLAMLWVVLGIILIAEFTASITSSLTVKQLRAEIGGPEDLPGKRIATVAGSTAAKYLEEKSLSYIPVARIEEAYPLLMRGAVDAIVYDSPVLIDYANRVGGRQVEVTGPILTEEAYAIALPAGSPWRKPINTAILRLQRDGTYDTLYEKWFGSQR